jgi:hypothetical protein
VAPASSCPQTISTGQPRATESGRQHDAPALQFAQHQKISHLCPSPRPVKRPMGMVGVRPILLLSSHVMRHAMYLQASCAAHGRYLEPQIWPTGLTALSWPPACSGVSSKSTNSNWRATEVYGPAMDQQCLLLPVNTCRCIWAAFGAAPPAARLRSSRCSLAFFVSDRAMLPCSHSVFELSIRTGSDSMGLSRHVSWCSISSTKGLPAAKHG